MSEAKFERFKEAYRQMAEVAKYRPEMPSDGFRGINRELNEPEEIEQEAWRFARLIPLSQVAQYVV
jgi:hypothetical protein